MPAGPRLAACGAALVPAPAPAVSLGNTLPFRDQEDYEKNTGLLLETYGAVFNSSGVDKQLQGRLLNSRVLRANLLAGQRVFDAGKTRMKEKPLSARDAGYVTECHSGVVRPVSERLSLGYGIARMTSIAAWNIAAHDVAALAPTIKPTAMRLGANPRVPASQVEQWAQQCQQQAEDIRSYHKGARYAHTLQQAASLDSFDAAASRVASASCSAGSIEALIRGMSPRCSMSDLLQDEAKRELELCAIMAAAFAALPDIRRLNDEYGFFARPAEPEHVLAPDMRRLIKDHIAAVRNLRTLRALSDRLGLAMSDSARRLLELLDELEPVLLPGWQVADPSDLLHGLTTAQFKAMRSQLDRQQATALAAAAEVKKANAGVMAAQASVAELGKALAQHSKHQEVQIAQVHQQMRLAQASTRSECIAAADEAGTTATSAQAKAQQAEAKAQQAEAKAQQAEAKAVNAQREVEAVKRKLDEMHEEFATAKRQRLCPQASPAPSGSAAAAAEGSAQPGRPLRERNGGGDFKAPAAAAAAMMATACAALDRGLVNGRAPVKILQVLDTGRDVSKLPVGLQAELAQQALEEAEAAAEGRRALAELQGREPSGDGHVDLLRAQADQLWAAVEAQPHFAFHPGAMGAAPTAPAVENKPSLQLSLQQALREFQTLAPQAEEGQPAPLARQGGVQRPQQQPRQRPRAIRPPPGFGSQPQHLAGVQQVQQQPQRATAPAVLPVLSAVLPAPADVLSTPALAAGAAANPLRSEVADTTQWLAGMNLSAEIGAALADGGVS